MALNLVVSIQLRGDMLESCQSVPKSEPMVSHIIDDEETLYDDMDPGYSQKTYTQLETTKTWSSRIVTARGRVDLGSWTMTHPEEWTTHEVLDWLFTVVQLIENFQFDNFRGEKFNNISGRELCRMTRENFCQLEPTYGDKLFTILNTMLKKAFFQEPETEMVIKQEIVEPSTMADDIGRGILMNNYDWMGPAAYTNTYTIGEFAYDFSLNDTPPISDPPFPEDNRSFDEDPGYSSSCSDRSNNNAIRDCLDPDVMFSQMEPSHNTMCQQQPAFMPCPGVVIPTMQYPSMNTSQVSKPHPAPTAAPPRYMKRGPGRPPRRRMPSADNTSDYFGSDDENVRVRTRGPGTHKGKHLWEFIRDLLKDSQYSNQLIKWENKEEGVFKIVSSEQVAKLWGAKKNNHTMTYEKFSRAMRFCRTAGYFSGVPKTGSYPKKLCFKFGPKSYGWKD